MATKERSTQQGLAFLEAVAGRPDLQQQLTAATDWPAARTIASNAGFDLSGLTESEARTLVTQHGGAKGRELSAADMAGVAGGAATSMPAPGIVTSTPVVPSVPYQGNW